MTGIKGRSGTNKNKDKPWADALRMAVLEDLPDGRKKLRAIAEKCVASAVEGDQQAIKEIGDRLDGKPMQSMDMTHDVGDALLSVLAEVNGRTRGLPSGGK